MRTNRFDRYSPLQNRSSTFRNKLKDELNSIIELILPLQVATLLSN